MPDYWFCQSCNSMNRLSAPRCYRCRAPKETSAVAVAQQRPKDVIAPGVVPTAGGAAPSIPSGAGYTNVSPLAMLSAAALTISILVGMATVGASAALLLAILAPDSFQIGDNGRVLSVVLDGALAICFLIAVVCHSVFLSQATANVPAVGGGRPRFGTMRAALWWLEALGWTIVAALVVWLPLAIGVVFAAFLLVPGLIAGTCSYWVATHIAGGPLGNVRKPVRLPKDLAERLEMEGETGHRLVDQWATLWTTARLIQIFMPVGIVLVEFLAVLIVVGRAISGASRSELVSGATDFYEALAAVYVLVLVIGVLADLAALFFMARFTLWVADVQNRRREWLAGLPDSASAGGPAAFAPPPPAAPAPAPGPAPSLMAPPSGSLPVYDGWRTAASPPGPAEQPPSSPPSRPDAPFD